MKLFCTKMFVYSAAYSLPWYCAAINLGGYGWSFDWYAVTGFLAGVALAMQTFESFFSLHDFRLHAFTVFKCGLLGVRDFILSGLPGLLIWELIPEHQVKDWMFWLFFIPLFVFSPYLCKRFDTR